MIVYYYKLVSGERTPTQKHPAA